jgi:Sulfotransferase family
VIDLDGDDLLARVGPTGAQTPQRDSDFADPVFILAPPCTFSWAVCAMLGQHPQLYALPELHLFSSETLSEWWDLCAHESYEMDHGLVRTVATLYFSEQTEATVVRARGWLRRRGHFTTGFLLEELARRLHPLIPIEKSPSIVYRTDFLQRALDMFPNARFLHLVSHPAAFAASVLEALKTVEKRQPLPPAHWLRRLARPVDSASGATSGDCLDPQKSWYALNLKISQFMDGVPHEQRMTLRGEDLLDPSNSGFLQVVAWLGLRADSEALEQMRHPERSPYAGYGPNNAPFGSDMFVMPGPILRPSWYEPQTLEGPLPWRPDAQPFEPEVKELAQRFGYR